MPGRLLTSCLLSTFLLMGCFASSEEGDDTKVTLPDFRKPPKPTVTYETRDERVQILIQGRNRGESRNYWIYRDKTLLDQPWSASSGDSSNSYFYYLMDSLEQTGTYTYQVYYGPRKDSLSDPSDPFVYKYEGPSPSGHVDIYQMDMSGFLQIRYLPREKVVYRRVIIERRVGKDGDIRAVDTLLGNFSWDGVADTSLVLEDTWVYYRARGQDVSEEWLPPSPWDSIEVRNKTWSYLPSISVKNLGTDVQVTLQNPLGTASAHYVLYRNTSESKDGKTAVDSAYEGQGSFGLLLGDAPEKPGTYWYWVEAADGRGRTSARSNPHRVEFTGRPRGPSIQQVYSQGTHVRVTFQSNQLGGTFVLERAADTAKPAVDADTLTLSSIQSGSYGEFRDRPPTDGRWHYRIVSLGADRSRSDPGDWSGPVTWRYAPNYQTLSASIVNRGDRVEVRLPSGFTSAGKVFVLYRSANPGGRDSVPADTGFTTSSFYGEILLKDSPAPGTWYYRVLEVSLNLDSDYLFRSDLMRVEFTGRATGPALVSLAPNYRHVVVVFQTDPDAVAYVLERAPDSASAWLAVDTVPAPSSSQPQVTTQNRPPAAGYWSYRVRSIRSGLAATDPGPSMRTPSPWSDAVVYETTQPLTVVNSGTSVTLSWSSAYAFEYETRVFRSAKDGHAEGTLVKTHNTYSGTFQDTPPIGTWYYWIEIHYSGSGSPPGNVVRRSKAMPVVFSGIPEVTQLAANSVGVTITFPQIRAGDTLQILRSTGKVEDTASYTVLYNVTDTWVYYHADVVDKEKAAFYHYRLRLIREGVPSGLGGAKSIYYDPAAPGSGMNQGLL